MTCAQPSIATMVMNILFNKSVWFYQTLKYKNLSICFPGSKVLSLLKM